MKIEKLTRDEKSLVVDALVDAFHDYPVMRFALHSQGNEFEKDIRTLIGFYCEARFAKDGHVLAIREGNEFAAIALIDEAIHKRWPTLTQELALLKEQIGESAFQRIQMYENTTAKLEPQAPHYFLGMIAARPRYQGKGYGGALLRRVQELSANDPASTGVCLSTERQDNVSLYERFGYKVIGEVDVADMHSWCMFLSTV